MLRLDAPLISFGGVVIDQINPVERFPGRSLLAGLFGNALGWDHRETSRLSRLQIRLRIAARWDAEPERWVDYHTVVLGQERLVDTGWTTRGRREDRGTGTATSGTHQRYRHFWANGVATVAVALAGDDDPDIGVLQSALLNPARPLFIGRKTCLPASPLLLGRRETPSLREALCREPLADIGPRRRPKVIEACWPADDAAGADTVERYDLRDWPNNLHRGSQPYAVGLLELTQ
ncbi:MAG: type I-E CRISPR-associated protein Cas5/CasD [Betaproteobacteria bacterium]